MLSSTSVRFPEARTHLGLHPGLGQNGAQSRIDHYLCFMGFLFFFSFFGFGFDNDLIMVGLWVVACGGCGLWVRWWWCWVVGSDSGGGGGVGGNASWVSNFFFAFWLWVLCDFGLLVVWKMRGIFGLDSKDLIGFGCVIENFEIYLQMLCSCVLEEKIQWFVFLTCAMFDF